VYDQLIDVFGGIIFDKIGCVRHLMIACEYEINFMKGRRG
jgi:hypothetical protein